MNLVKNKNIMFSCLCCILIYILVIIPTGFTKQIYLNAEGVKAKVLSTNESAVHSTGLIKQGSQTCTIKILNGTFKGQQIEAVNYLTGRLEFDKIFAVGDKAFVLLEKSDKNEIIFVNMIDHYRLNLEGILILIFMICLIAFSGSTGVRTIISFIFSLVCIWKLLIPMLLKGYNPMIVSLAIGISISVVTLILVAGFTKKAYCAILGSLCSSLFTGFLAIIFGNIFKIHGAVMPWSESLLYAGYENLNLTLIYQSAIYLSCSGAILDLSIDISAAISELVDNKPDISSKQIFISAMNIGKSIVGAQSTTLLLAYMGSFITIMMVYMAQGTPLLSVLNSKAIASEILHTFVGCIGLVLVSPITAIICSYFYSPYIFKHDKIKNKFNKGC